VNQGLMITREQWYPGEPEASFWMGLKLNKGVAVIVSTFRCPSCGYLESYAGAAMHGLSTIRKNCCTGPVQSSPH
jgi:hypothetical protein